MPTLEISKFKQKGYSYDHHFLSTKVHTQNGRKSFNFWHFQQVLTVLSPSTYSI